MSRPVYLKHESEPIRGLPGALPEGEHILWQGSPAWWPLALRAYRLRAVAIYFAVLWLIGFYAELREGAMVREALIALVPLTILALVALGLILTFAVLAARLAVYTITNRRVVVRCGVALPVTVNLPFALVASAGLKRFGDGTGDIALRLIPPHRVSYVLLWPHVRPWHWRDPEPSLRAVRQADEVAAILGRALAQAAGQPVPTMAEAAAAPEPLGPAPVPA
ncbi:MAG: photosynthetic complex putative assembly protein PuhB [Acetobacteraceae bacterium]|nr:photosynthetic complex putative assembly protein PuhB [Acetobacteraceae bacterium]